MTNENQHDGGGSVKRANVLDANTGARRRRWEIWVTGALLTVVPGLLGAKGCEIGNLGSDSRACGGLQGRRCASDEFCNFPEEAMCGAADATGVCEPLPQACDDVFAPVCGCDDKTYGNECEANAAGVSVAKFDACEETAGADCGGLLGLRCSDGEFCNFPIEATCGAADRLGTCEVIPEACTEQYAPVCGCDGVTYDNECFARAEGVSVASEGGCEGTTPPTDGGSPQVCGTRGAEACEDGDFCLFPSDSECGATDRGGTCEPKPDVCTKEYAPVCGCDGQTYGNECMAHAAGISVATKGECESDPVHTCGGIAGEACDRGEFCNFPIDAQCGAADQTGVCEPIPTACTREYAPVCGCDGQTYGNECSANAAGVSVVSRGECASDPAHTCGGIAGETCDRGEFCNFPIDAQCGAADQTGVCEPIPTACTREYAPVCGCDGQTYGNECSANAAGVSVVSRGECEPTQPDNVCGGLAGLTCDEGLYCNYPINTRCGSGDQTGSCERIPELCTEEYLPVCGCDGETYGNTCYAAAAGVSIASKGACESSGPVACGARLGDTCGKGEFCDFTLDAICGFADATGTCTPIPEGCTKEYAPVCGCDGKTYSNTCIANSAGVAVASEGSCDTTEPTGEACGGLLGLTCPDTEYCSYAPEALCGTADATGTCAPRPEACPAVYLPVCGCDGRTYGNACEAGAAGVSVAADGACEDTAGATCGGLVGGACPDGEFCNYPLDAMCGAADQTGVCEPIPEACTEEYEPVCGCDDRTYGNACAANAAGVSVAALGECR